jgi:hypothetical protein
VKLPDREGHLTSAATPPLSRRAIFCVVPVILLGGCASVTERAHQRFFAAVKADPLFSWKPDWAISDNFAERSGDQPFREDTGADVTRIVVGRLVPTDAIDAAEAFAVSVGWSLKSPQILGKNLTPKNGCQLTIGINSTRTGLTFMFVSWVTT